LETRRLHALTREEAVDRFSMDAKDTPDAHRIQSPIVNQAPNRLRVHTELICNLAHAHEAGISVSGRHHHRPSLARSPVRRISRSNQPRSVGT
jgi:hypothetical protein